MGTEEEKSKEKNKGGGGEGREEIKREGLKKSMQHGSTSEEKYLAGMWEGFSHG